MVKEERNTVPYNTALITGGAGFVGSNLAMALKGRYPSLRVLALDNLRRRGGELNIKRLMDRGVEFIHGDIRNPEDLEFSSGVDLLIECSAEPSVLAGYGESPTYLINTNLVGTINCLEMARKNKSHVIFISTSRVYPYDAINGIRITDCGSRFEWEEKQDREVLGWSKKGINTGFTLNGSKSMYGATKLCSEIILQEYIRMYGLKGVINRCGVIAGPWQFGKVDQGVFTLWMLAHYFKRPLKYIGFGGEGKQVRDLLHINDLFELIDRQISCMEKVNERIFNVGGGKESSLSLLETTGICADITGNKIPFSHCRENRPADVAIYYTDNTEVYEELRWKPEKTATDILEDVYSWIHRNEKSISQALTG